MPKLDPGDLELQTSSEMQMSLIFHPFGRILVTFQEVFSLAILCAATLSATPHHFRMEFNLRSHPSRERGPERSGRYSPPDQSTRDCPTRGGLDWIQVFQRHGKQPALYRKHMYKQNPNVSGNLIACLPASNHVVDLGNLNRDDDVDKSIIKRQLGRVVGHRTVTFHISPRPGPGVCRIDAHEWVLSWLYYLLVVFFLHPTASNSRDKG